MKPAAKQKVLIGFAEALSAPEVVWSLVDAGFSVTGFARKGRASALRYSRHLDLVEICAPETDAAQSAEQLQSAIEALAVVSAPPVVVLPLDDAFLWLAQQLNPSSQWRFAGPPRSAVAFALDKRAQCAAAALVGLHVPTAAFVESGAELRSIALPFPLILRPAQVSYQQHGRLKKGRNVICCDDAERERAAANMDAGLTLVQPFITGCGEGFFGFATPDGVVAWSAHRRVRMMNPHGSGSSACATSDVPTEIAAQIEKMVQSIGWRGLFMVEMLRDETGKLWFVEFNGRAWGSMALARRQGLEYPAWNVALALDSTFRPPPISPRSSGFECRNLGRELMHLLFVLRGAKTRAIRQWPSFWRSLLQVLPPRRRRKWYNWRSDDWRVFFADGFYTLRDNIFKRN